jgi:hypothetical protein
LIKKVLEVYGFDRQEEGLDLGLYGRRKRKKLIVFKEKKKKENRKGEKEQ